MSQAIEPDITALHDARLADAQVDSSMLATALAALDKIIVVICAMALVAASLILSYSVATRYLFQSATYWQDEAAVFLIVGATFMSAGHVQSRRGHVAIDALAEMLSPAANRLRLRFVDAASLAFCAFFAWKSWSLTEEAWTDGQVSSSTWGPPLSIPYGLMSVGMTLLSLQIALQLAAGLKPGARPNAETRR